jgi:hypothetical protein
MAEIGWIDFSRKDRNRVNNILDLLRPEGQVDELGIGTLRDGLADRLFPGISTIQTRAKYFFIVPYILWDFLKMNPSERKKRKPTVFLEEQEYEVMWDLADEYKRQEGHGVIGISKRREFREKIARRPSEIYWNGLNVMKCIDSRGLSANAFLNRANRVNAETLVHAIAEEGHGDDHDAGFENYFNIKVPYPPNWREGLRLELTAEEAAFLKDSLIDQQSAVLALVMQDEDAYEIFLSANSFFDFTRLCLEKPMHEELKKALVHAHDFAVLMEGAHIAYNQELQSQFFFEDSFVEGWNAWYEALDQTMINLSGFKAEELFLYSPTTRPQTKYFVTEWVKLMQAEVFDEDKKKQLIRDQEYYAKGKKARLRFNRKDDVQSGKRIGLTKLEYRYSNAKIIVQDIKNGLQNA